MTNSKFNNWFVGFFEGNGSFVIDSNSGRCYLIIDQKHVKVLIYIKDNLKVGSIKKYQNYYRLTISSKKDMYYVLTVLNGHLILNNTNKRLHNFINNYNKYYRLNVEDPYYLIFKGQSTFNKESSWLSGFIDAQGCFNIRIVSFSKMKRHLLDLLKEFDNVEKDLFVKDPLYFKRLLNLLDSKELKNSMSLRIRLRFTIRQKREKDLLKNISIVYGGSVKQIKEGIFEYCLDSNSKIKRIIDYIDNNPLNSIKHIDFLKFKIAYNRLNNKEHLDIKEPIKVINWLKKV